MFVINSIYKTIYKSGMINLWPHIENNNLAKQFFDYFLL